MGSKTPGKKISGRLYSFGSSVTPIFLIMNHLLYLLSTKYDKMKKISLYEVIFFLNFPSSCHRIPVVGVIIDRAYENTCRGWTLLFTTSLAAWNYLKIPPQKPMHGNLHSNGLFLRIFDGLAEEATSRYYDRFIEIKTFFHCHFLRNKVRDHIFFHFWSKYFIS